MNIPSKLILSIICFIFLASVSAPAYAYLDPGTGSALLQGILAGIAGGLAVIKLYWQRLKNFFSRKNQNNKSVDHKEHE